MNWGWGIFIFIVIFIVFMLNMVYRCSLQRVDLVSEKYYEKEIKYQQQIDMEKNSASLPEKLVIRNEKDLLSVDYPSFNGIRSGTITFFRPDDSREDFTIAVKDASVRSQSIDTKKLKRGLWTVQVQWTQDGQSFYTEEKILIN